MEFSFWESSNGECPVQDFILGLEDRKSQQLLKKLESFSKYPSASLWKAEVLEKFDDELTELRILLHKTYYRLFCIIDGQSCILLHAFIKKSDKTSMKEVERAKHNMAVFYKQKKIGKTL
jgi:phage-related protein